MTIDDAFSHIPSFSTKNLSIRPMRIDDAENLHLIKSDPSITALYGEEPHVSVDQTSKWVQECIDGHISKEVMAWSIVLQENDRVIGMVCYWNFHKKDLCAEIGYEIHSDHWRKGVMTEVLSELVSYGFLTVGLNRIEGSPLAQNEPSRRLLEKMGFTLEGVLRQHVLFRGQYLDECIYGLLRDEWMGRSGSK